MDLGDPSYKPIRVLGSGSFGKVFLCKDRNNQNVCVKRIIVKNPKVEMNLIMEEVYILSQLKHPNTVQFIHSYVHAGTVNIVMEHAPNGTLHELIVQSLPKGGLTNSYILRFFCDILMGLEYLHIRHVLHRDLKPPNILVDATHHLKIADFGISLVHTPHKGSVDIVGTPFYMAPEVLKGQKIESKSDIWSVGCILHEMCLGYNPFYKAASWEDVSYMIRVMTERQKLDCSNIRKKNGHLWATLCERMIVYNLRERISLPEILALDPALTIPYYNKYFDYQY